jgi:hypothetical protein
VVALVRMLAVAVGPPGLIPSSASCSSLTHVDAVDGLGVHTATKDCPYAAVIASSSQGAVPTITTTPRSIQLSGLSTVRVELHRSVRKVQAKVLRHRLLERILALPFLAS